MNILVFYLIDDWDKELIKNSVFSCYCEFGRVVLCDKGLCLEIGGCELLEWKKRKVLKKIFKIDILCVNYD